MSREALASGAVVPRVQAGEGNGSANVLAVSGAVADFRRLIEFAAASPELSGRLALSRTITRIVLREAPPVVLTVLFDREPVEVLDGSPGTAESEIEMAATDLAALARGELQLPIAIAKGRLAYSGCVRKFLRAAPILRRAARLRLAQADGQVSRAPTASEGEAGE